jgi:hypothetical protein
MGARENRDYAIIAVAVCGVFSLVIPLEPIYRRQGILKGCPLYRFDHQDSSSLRSLGTTEEGVDSHIFIVGAIVRSNNRRIDLYTRLCGYGGQGRCCFCVGENNGTGADRFGIYRIK